MIHQPLFLYLHGLNSSPASLKALNTASYIASHSLNLDVHIPVLPTEPDDVVALLKSLTESVPEEKPVYIIGSSLGGYLGTWLHKHLLQHHHHQVRLVVVNPAVKAYDRFEEFVGPQENLYTGEKWELTHRHAEQLKNLEVDTLLSPESILLLAQTDDEVLDYRLAVEKYKECRSIIQKGGNHGFEGYEQILPTIFEFLLECTVSGSPSYPAMAGTDS